MKKKARRLQASDSIGFYLGGPRAPLFPLGDPPLIRPFVIMFSDYYGFHGPMRCAILLAIIYASQVASLRYPLAPFLRRQLALKLATFGRLFPLIPNYLYSHPCLGPNWPP